MEQQLKVGGVFTFELIRGGKVIDSWEEKNLVVNEGLNALLDGVLGGGAQFANWHVGIYEANYTPTSALTAANVAATATECIAYAETTRPPWDNAPASSQQITNTASKATFTIDATKNIYGAFLISDGTKGGAIAFPTVCLFAASKFAVARAVVAEDQLLVTYTVQSASA